VVSDKIRRLDNLYAVERKMKKMGFVIRSKTGLIFETTEVGKTGEQTFDTKEVAETALEEVQKLYKDEEFYVVPKK
jgi:hypothetical protein